ncbi:hypothetical protein G6F35_015065 [Rhizopus arrhizus]|nr:hypothetical protein G6F35_015065 [Rhizopus arrhizus]KAG1383820.1 hypothetical protein G6F59_017768 [Rhizopus arrhizus]
MGALWRSARGQASTAGTCAARRPGAGARRHLGRLERRGRRHLPPQRGQPRRSAGAIEGAARLAGADQRARRPHRAPAVPA